MFKNLGTVTILALLTLLVWGCGTDNHITGPDPDPTPISNSLIFHAKIEGSGWAIELTCKNKDGDCPGFIREKLKQKDFNLLRFSGCFEKSDPGCPKRKHGNLFAMPNDPPREIWLNVQGGWTFIGAHIASWEDEDGLGTTTGLEVDINLSNITTPPVVRVVG